MVYDCLTLPHTPVVHQKCSPYKMAHFCGISPILRHPEGMDQNLLGWRSEAVLTMFWLRHISIFDHIPIQYYWISPWISLWVDTYKSIHIHIYIDVFIELYCDISDIPLKYVFLSTFLHETQRQTCNVPGSVVSLIHTMDTSVTWIGDPPAIFFGWPAGRKTTLRVY